MSAFGIVQARSQAGHGGNPATRSLARTSLRTIALALVACAMVGLDFGPTAGAALGASTLVGELGGQLILAGGATTVASVDVPWTATVTGDPQSSGATFSLGQIDQPLPDPEPWGLGDAASGTIEVPGPGSYTFLLRYFAADGRVVDLVAGIDVAVEGAPAPTPLKPTPPAGPSGPADPAALHQSYRLEVALNYDAAELDTVETMTITNAGATAIGSVDLSVISKATGEYTQGGTVTVDGAVASTQWTTGTNLQVAFPTALPAGATAELRVAFHLQVTGDMGIGRSVVTPKIGVLALGEWFPILSREHDVNEIGDEQVSWNADEIVLDLTSDQALPRNAVACEGDIVTAPQTSGTHWVCQANDVRNYALAVSPRFQLASTHVGSVTIRSYSVSGRGGRAAAIAAGAIAAYIRAYGPAPYASLTLAEAGPDEWANEFPAFTFLGPSVIDNTYVVYHEVAHQWFYAALGNDQLVDPIVDEGLAEFSADTALGRPFTYRSSVVVDAPVDRWSTGQFAGDGGYFETVYHRGAAFFEGLRLAMGSGAFYGTIRTLLVTDRFGVITHQELFSARSVRMVP